MKFIQVKTPNYSVEETVLWCLRHVRRIYGINALHPDAWTAWLNAKHRHTTRTLPNVSVPVFFEWGAQGHIVSSQPGVGLWSTPLSGHGHKLYKTIEEVERAIGCRFVGWSLDLNGVMVAKQVTVATQEQEEEEMSKYIGHYIGGDSKTPANDRACVIYDPRSGFYTTWSQTSQEYHNAMAQQYKTGNFNHITKKHWDQTIKPQLDKLLNK